MPEHDVINKSHFLPEHEVKAFKTVSKLQVFEDKSEHLLDQVGEAIKASDSSRTRTVSSIPTIFARPLLFKMALFDKNHPLHAEITDEWRGLMSCFILAHQLQLDIKFEKVEYNKKSKFFRAYESLKFKPEKLGQPGALVEYEWTKPFIISINVYIGGNKKRMVVGGTSPSTLFYTSPDYTDVAKALAAKGLPTFDKPNEDISVFSQPRSNEHVLVVYKWLDQMIGNEGRLKNAFSNEDDVEKIKGDILDLFFKWKEDLEKIIDDLKLNKEEPVKDLNIPAEDEPDFFPFPLADHRIYRLASAPMVAKKVGANSDLFLVASNLSDSRIVVCDESFGTAGDLVIYNSIKTSNIGAWRDIFVGASGDSIGGLKLPSGVEWIVPARYFLSQELIRVNENRAFTKSKKQDRPTDGTGYVIPGGESYVLPFTKEFIDLYGSSKEIIESLKPSFEEKNGKVEFSFNIKLQYLGNYVIRIKKEYALKPTGKDEGQIIEVEAPPPLLAFWPHFYHEKWNRYFVYKRKMIKNGEREFDFEPYAFLKGISEVKDTAEYNNYDVMEISDFPDAMIVKFQSHPVGVILINKDDDYAVVDNVDIRFGVDFGTSNTNLWYSQNANNPAKVLDVLVMPRVLTENNINTTTLNLRNSFFSYEKPRIPFATVVKKLIPDAKRPIFDGMIQFVSEPKLDNADNLLETNIKWGGDSSIRELFVEHMLLILCAEARIRGASKIIINVSYPLAYSPTVREAYIKSFRDLIEQKFTWYGEAGCITVNKMAGASEDAFTESVAVGKYFAKTIESAKITGGSVCVDVGGGTSDISIWFDKSIIYQSSLYLAGNVVSNCFRKSNDLRRVVFTDLENKKDELADLLSKNIQNTNIADEDTFFAAIFNLLLKKYGSAIERKLPNLLGDETYNHFRSILVVEYASIIFYCGMIIQKIRMDNHRMLTNLPNLYWAGGASAFVKWIDYGSAMHSKSASFTFFSEILKAFYYTKDEKSTNGFKAAIPESELTKDPKSECAFGLLVNEKNIGETIAAGSAIIGETIRLDSGVGPVVDHTAELNSRTGSSSSDSGILDFEQLPGIPVEEEDPGVKYYSEFYGFIDENNGVFEPQELGAKFTRFIAALNALSRNYGIMSPINLKDYPHLATNIKSQIREAAKKASDKKDDEGKGKTVRVEPIFIIEVKELIKEMIKKLP